MSSLLDISLRVRALERALADAISRCEVNAWSARSAATTSADRDELDALLAVARAIARMSRALNALNDDDNRDGRSRARASAELERARRGVFVASARARERATLEGDVARECLAFVEMPGDREYVDVGEEEDFEFNANASASEFAVAHDEIEREVERRGRAETNTFLRAANDDDEDFYGVDAYDVRVMTPERVGENDGYEGAYEGARMYDSEMKSSLHSAAAAESPGSMSEDSARYYNDRRDGEGEKKSEKASRDQNGRGWLAFALSAIVVGGAMQFIGSPRAAAMGAEARRRATAAKARAATMARDSVNAAKNAVADTVHAQRARASARKAQELKIAAANNDDEPTYHVVHTRAGTTSRAADEFASMPARDFRWKPHVLLGRG